jgi:Thermolysin metallopeptidase, alpha-helical domain
MRIAAGPFVPAGPDPHSLRGCAPALGAAGSAGAPAPRNPVPGEDAAARSAINGVSDFFRSLGVGEAEGNAPGLRLSYVDTENAYYSMDRDEILIGRGKQGSMAQSHDVIAHEFAHRVINGMLRLDPRGDGGVMHESLADTFASAMDDDWKIGEDVVPGGIRDMLNPEALGSPGHMDQYVRTGDADADSHVNNGIPNKAAALIGEQLGKPVMAQIYVDAMKNHMNSKSGIVETAQATLLAARDRYGKGSEQVAAVAQAWDAVGVLDLALGAGERPGATSGRAALEQAIEAVPARVVLIV